MTDKPYQEKPERPFPPGIMVLLGGALFVFAATMLATEAAAEASENPDDFAILLALALAGLYVMVRAVMRMRDES